MDYIPTLRQLAERREDRKLQWGALTVLSDRDPKFATQMVWAIFRNPRDAHEITIAHIIAARLALARSEPCDAYSHLMSAAAIGLQASISDESLVRKVANSLQQAGHPAEAINLRATLEDQSLQRWCVDSLRDACALLELNDSKGRTALNEAYENALDDVAAYYELDVPPRAGLNLWSDEYDPCLDPVLIAALARSAEWWAEEQRFTDCAGMGCVFDAFLEVGRRTHSRRQRMILAIEAFLDLHDGDEDELEEFSRRLSALKDAVD